MTAEPLADAWLEQLSAISATDLAATTRRQAEQVVFDALGVAAGGPAAPGAKAAMDGFAAALGPGHIRLPWIEDGLSPVAAAASLSLLIHAWDFDDTHDAAVVHTGTVVVPAALAGALSSGGSGADVLCAVVVGVQVFARLALAIGSQRGVVRTAGLGAAAAAAAAARAMRCTPGQFADAIRLALPMLVSPTSRQAVSDGSISKRIQPAQATQAGVTAAFLAASGISGPRGWLDGQFGLLQLAPGELSADGLAAQGWEVAGIGFKPYPCCRYAHAAIHGALQVRRAGITEAVVRVPRGTAYEIVSRPFARRGQPVVDAQFSIPWLVAAAVTFDGVGLDVLTPERLADADVRALAANVRVIQDQVPAADGMAPAIVSVTDATGSHDAVVTAAPGSAAAPLKPEQLLAKARSCIAVGGFDSAAADRLACVIQRMDEADAAELARSIAAVDGRATRWTSA